MSKDLSKRAPIASPASVGQAVQGRDVDLDPVARVTTAFPALAPGPKFLLAVHASSWSVNGGYLLPNFYTIPVQHGIEGITGDLYEGKIDWSPAAAKAARSGWTVIPVARGPGGRGYLREIDLENGQKTYVTCFDTVYANDRRVDCDLKAMSEWVWSLVADGTIPAPSIVGLRAVRDRTAAATMRAATKAKTSAEAEAQANAMAADLEFLDSKIAEIQKANSRPVSSVEVDI